jgi:hypothetical protein
LTRAASTPPQPPWPEPGEAPETRARQEKEPGSSGLGLSLSIMSWLDNVKMETGSAPTNAPGRRKAGRELHLHTQGQTTHPKEPPHLGSVVCSQETQQEAGQLPK